MPVKKRNLCKFPHRLKIKRKLEANCARLSMGIYTVPEVIIAVLNGFINITKDSLCGAQWGHYFLVARML